MIIDGDAGNNTLTGTGADDRIRGLGGNDRLSGLGGRDRLEGGAGRDYLTGGAGADLLIGGLGRDTMQGGSGSDTFRFDDKDAGDATAGPLSDVILDFAPEDVLDILAVDVLDFAGDGVRSPERGSFSWWQAGGSTFVTWNTFGDFHDVELRGFTGDPLRQIHWYPDDYLAAAGTTGRIAAGQTRAGVIEVDQDADWFRINLHQGKAYEFDIRGAAQGGGTLNEPYVALFDAQGNHLAGNYEDFRFLASEPGTYFVEVSGGGYNHGTYRLAVKELADDFAADPGTAGRIAPGQTKGGAIEWEGDADWFRISLKQGKIYDFDIRGAGQGGGTLNEPYAALFDAQGNFLTDGFEGVGFLAAETGRYFVQASGGGYNHGTYHLAVKELVDDFDADTGTAGRIAPGQTKAGAIEWNGDADWFRISLERGKIYDFDILGAAQDGGTLGEPYPALLDAQGNLLAEGFEGFGFLAAETGTYYVQASGGGSNHGTYHLAAAETDWVQWSGNGHWYALVIDQGGITWGETKASADVLADQGGHLVTLTSAAENDFVFDALANNPAAWRDLDGPWIGLAQDPSGAEPDGGWKWVTGEEAIFYNWEEGEPNNGLGGGDESVGHYLAYEWPGRTWNDNTTVVTLNGYLVEVDDPLFLA